MDSVPPAITQSAEPELIFAQAKCIASKPEPQYLLSQNPEPLLEATAKICI